MLWMLGEVEQINRRWLTYGRSLTAGLTAGLRGSGFRVACTMPVGFIVGFWMGSPHQAVPA